MKICSKCGEEKSLGEYAKCCANPDGLQYVCRACSKKHRAGRSAANSRRSFSECPPTKVCCRCGDTPPREDFYADLRATDGLVGYCKPCGRKGNRESRARADQEKLREYANEYYRLNRTKLLSESVERRFKLRKGEYAQMRAAQGDKCYICKRHSSEFDRNLAVDHCHSTGKVRGLLCNKCNQALGGFGDDVERLGEAISYLGLEQSWWRDQNNV